MSEVDNEEAEAVKRRILKIILIVIGILVLIAGTAWELCLFRFLTKNPQRRSRGSARGNRGRA